MSTGTAAPVRARRRAPSPRRAPRSGRRLALSVLAMLACAGIALVTVTDPYAGAHADPYYRAPVLAKPNSVQRFAIDGGYVLVQAKRDRFTTEVVGASGAAAAAAPLGPVVPAGTAQAYAAGLVAGRGWASSEFSCLVALWNRESGWNSRAANPSGAYGIPQSLPGSKMASAGGDWQNSAETQITWGLGYISGSYGSPCGAWAHSNAVGWY